MFGAVVDMLGQGYAFWASTVETFHSRAEAGGSTPLSEAVNMLPFSLRPSGQRGHGGG